MSEPLENIITVCKECTDTRHDSWQDENKDLEIKPGMYVKKAFTQRKNVEHMWVEVTAVNGETITGIVDNDPIYLTNVKCGDSITFHRSEIEQHLLPE